MTDPTESAETATKAPPDYVTSVAPFAPAASATSPTPVTIDDLVLRMRVGDREAAAEFLMRYGSRIRRRIRGKLGSSMRRLFDSLEILSTLGRRLDLYVMSGRLQAANESQLWSLLFKMADNALIDKARLFNRLRAAESEDGEFAQQLVVRLRQAEGEPSSSVEVEIDNCLRSISDAMDRKILSLWLTGEPHTSIAHLVDMPATAVRKRWEKIKQELKGRFETAGAR